MIVAIIVLAAGAAYIYHKSKEPKPAKTTSTAKTAQNDYSSGTPRNTNVPSGGTNQGGATDNNTNSTSGSSSGSGSSGSSVSSASGAITLTGISANDLLSNGEYLTGNATVGQIQFRIVDDTVGVLAQGQLSVVNGKFSGTLHFTPRGSTGRLDVFSYGTSGSEINSVEIPVRFK